MHLAKAKENNFGNLENQQFNHNKSEGRLKKRGKERKKQPESSE